jgi:NRPS condensation-like uncharacterized protein
MATSSTKPGLKRSGSRRFRRSSEARRVPLDILDELLLLIGEVHAPVTMHAEVRVEGHVDAERLIAAIRQATEVHPIARARLIPARLTERRYHWEISDSLDSIPLEVVDCEDDSALARAREELISHSPQLDTPGPFEVVLAHHPEGDAIILNVHHSVGDGAGLYRFVTSILRAYVGEPDPPAPVDPLAARDLRALLDHSFRARRRRGRGWPDVLRRIWSPPARVASPLDTERAGYGVELMVLTSEQIDEAMSHAPEGAGLNSVMQGSLAVAIRRWNDARGADTGDVYLSMPVNFRPPEWSRDVFGNFAPWAAVRVARSEQSTLASAITAAGEHVRRIKENDIAALMVDQIELPYELPSGLGRWAPRLNPRRIAVDTAMLSNLGRIRDVPAELDDAGRITAMWESPAHDPYMRFALAATTFGSDVFVGFRYHRAGFDAAMANDFLRLYADTMLGRESAPVSAAASG